MVGAFTSPSKRIMPLVKSFDCSPIISWKNLRNSFRMIMFKKIWYFATQIGMVETK
jgi:hypothetical protein